MLTDLQRFRKLLNIKKSFYVFHETYNGKNDDLKDWYQEVEERVTQTFVQLNIRRLINIIGYDPSLYFQGILSYANIDRIEKGNLDFI